MTPIKYDHLCDYRIDYAQFTFTCLSGEEAEKISDNIKFFLMEACRRFLSSYGTFGGLTPMTCGTSYGIHLKRIR